jgi:hypothetical protein
VKQVAYVDGLELDRLLLVGMSAQVRGSSRIYCYSASSTVEVSTVDTLLNQLIEIGLGAFS